MTGRLSVTESPLRLITPLNSGDAFIHVKAATVLRLVLDPVNRKEIDAGPQRWKIEAAIPLVVWRLVVVSGGSFHGGRRFWFGLRLPEQGGRERFQSLKPLASPDSFTT